MKGLWAIALLHVQRLSTHTPFLISHLATLQSPNTTAHSGHTDTQTHRHTHTHTHTHTPVRFKWLVVIQADVTSMLCHILYMLTADCDVMSPSNIWTLDNIHRIRSGCRPHLFVHTRSTQQETVSVRCVRTCEWFCMVFAMGGGWVGGYRLLCNDDCFCADINTKYIWTYPHYEWKVMNGQAGKSMEQLHSVHKDPTIERKLQHIGYASSSSMMEAAYGSTRDQAGIYSGWCVAQPLPLTLFLG